MTPPFGTPEDRVPLIEIKNVSKIFQNAAGEFPALIDVQLDFFDGEFVGVIGKSGSGKSTLVNMLTGIDHPSRGKVIVGGLDVHAMKESAQARWRGKNLGVVFQFFQLLPMLTLAENVLLPMDFCDVYKPEERMGRAMSLLELVGLGGEVHKLPGAVSVGQQQSAAIARALANDPQIIVADEPTGNLDVKTAESVYDHFTNLAAEGRTIIMITHDPEIEQRLSRKILLADGCVIDPILVATLPWMPHSDLLNLNDKIERISLSSGDRLDINGRFSDQWIVVESGALRVSLFGYQITLKPGGQFAGLGIIEAIGLRDCLVDAQASPTRLAVLPRDTLYEALESTPDGQERMLDGIKRSVLGKTKEGRGGQGVIR